MKILRLVAAVLGVAAFITGTLMAQPADREAGQALIIRGAIILCRSVNRLSS